MTVFFIAGFIVSLLTRIMLGVFAGKVSWFSQLLTPFTYITVGSGVVMAVFIGIEIYRKLRK